jgi:O-methyltransferase/methyltransferase family protein
MAVPQRSDSTANVLLNLIDGHRVTAAIYVAAKLGIADLLADSPRSISELARLTDTHERSLFRLMRALVKLAICTDASGGRFQLTEVGMHLAANSECSLKAFVLLEGGMLRAGWGALNESVRTGKTAAELAGQTPQEHFASFAKREPGVFDEAMKSITRMAVSALLSSYNFSGISILMDVGGGLGQLMSGILKEYPSTRGIVFDLPHCAAGAEKHISEAGLTGRCKFVAGSFFESVPDGADAIIMKSIIHDWNDERCVQILRNCRLVLEPGARLMLIEKVIPEKVEAGGSDLFVLLDDLNMLQGPGGCERTSSEFRELLAKGGFGMRRVVPTGRYSVIESIAT